MFSVFGAVGQALYNRADAQKFGPNAVGKEDHLKKESWLNSKWSPVKVLSDEEYETMLQQRLLRANAEIALIDESIAALKAKEISEREQIVNESNQVK